jgi:hypothetical protein
MIMAKKGENIIMFINESIYVRYSKSTRWIDSGATVHVANSLLGFRSTRTTQRRERCIKVANRVQADVEAIGDLSLELANGFMLLLRDVLCVPSLQRNLISVSCLDNAGYDCHFRNGKCEIWFNAKCVGLAFRQDEFYLLSLHENVNSDVNENVSSPVNANRKQKRTHDVSSKLWHCRLGHISRRRIEILVKNKILPPLEFLDLEQYIECIKEKYVKKIKKCQTKCRNFRDKFKIFTDDYSRFNYIYPIKERIEALDKFKIFKTEVANQHNLKMKIVRSDRRGEYYGRHTLYGQVPGPFARFLQENVIVA